MYYKGYSLARFICIWRCFDNHFPRVRNPTYLILLGLCLLAQFQLDAEMNAANSSLHSCKTEQNFESAPVVVDQSINVSQSPPIEAQVSDTLVVLSSSDGPYSQFPPTEHEAAEALVVSSSADTSLQAFNSDFEAAADSEDFDAGILRKTITNFSYNLSHCDLFSQV